MHGKPLKNNQDFMKNDGMNAVFSQLSPIKQDLFKKFGI
jgi:hypothetical protein